MLYYKKIWILSILRIYAFNAIFIISNDYFPKQHDQLVITGFLTCQVVSLCNLYDFDDSNVQFFRIM